jgi:hypothetical protein
MEPQSKIDPESDGQDAMSGRVLPALDAVIDDLEGALAKLDAVGLYGCGASLSGALDELRSYRGSLQNGANGDT